MGVVGLAAYAPNLFPSGSGVQDKRSRRNRGLTVLWSVPSGARGAVLLGSGLEAGHGVQRQAVGCLGNTRKISNPPLFLGIEWRFWPAIRCVVSSERVRVRGLSCSN